MAESNRELLDAFSAKFAAHRSDIQSKLQDIDVVSSDKQSSLEAISADLGVLRKLLADGLGSDFIPSYDQRKFGDELKELEGQLQALQAASPAKPRFAFKRKAGSATIPSAPKTAAAQPTAPAASVAADTLSIAGKMNVYVTLSTLRNKDASNARSPDLTMVDLNFCLIDLRASADSNLTLSAVHVQNVRNSVLLLPKLQGSILLHDIENCVMVVDCQQFRMHTSTAVDVFLSIPSHPVIEHCSRIRFGNISGESNRNLSFSPQDFSHIRDTPSPNWTALTATEPALITSDLNGDFAGQVRQMLLQPGVLPTSSEV